MYIFLIIVHVIACLVLIAVILLQAGRGGGLNEAFSGGAQSILGTQAGGLLKKATTVSAVTFLLTSLLLGGLTARTGKSLLERFGSQVLPVAPVQGMPPLAPLGPETIDQGAVPALPVDPAAPVEVPQPESQPAPIVGEQS